MRFGYFDNEHREYVITDPRTPVKWINYIGTQTVRRLRGPHRRCADLQRRPNLQPHHQIYPAAAILRLQGRDLIFADPYRRKSYRIFSPFFVPTLDHYDRFECRVGLGYTRIVSEFYGLLTEAMIFVPLQGTCELRDIKVTNISATPLDVDAIPVVEYTHPNALMQFTNADWVPQTMVSKCVQDGEFRIMLQYPFMFRDTRINYLASNLPASSFETDRKSFLGDNEYGTFQSPLSLRAA